MGRILIIDDEPGIRLFFSDVLTEQGYRVSEAPSGAVALKLLSREPFDMVIMDIDLRSENGPRLLERLVAEYPRLPIIVCSTSCSFADDPLAQLAKSSIVKSCDPGELLREIRRILSDQPTMAR
ncbi:MAG: response regulator [Acidobacteria bacterium]|nr:MAG: response regulator [Acidobacteriota bacterium]